jgi:excinuclease ABC subunit C
MPCTLSAACSPEEYKKVLHNVELFLSGKQQKLIDELKNQMIKYANNNEFEKAARYRDSYLDVQKTMEKQRVIYENTSINQDVIALVRDATFSGLTLMQIRSGRLIDKKDFELTI